MKKFKYLKYILGIMVFGIISAVSTNILAENEHIAFDDYYNFIYGEIDFGIDMKDNDLVNHHYETWDEISVHLHKEGPLKGKHLCSYKNATLHAGMATIANSGTPRSGEITLKSNQLLKSVTYSETRSGSGKGNTKEEAEANANTDAYNNASAKCDADIAAAVAGVSDYSTVENDLETQRKKLETGQPFKSLEIIKDSATTRRTNENGKEATFKGKPADTYSGGQFNGEKEGLTYGFWGEYLYNNKDTNKKFKWAELQRAAREFSRWNQYDTEQGNDIWYTNLVSTVDSYYDFQNKNIKVGDKTKVLNIKLDSNGAKIKENLDNNYYLIGPFTFNYSQKIENSILFSWIDEVEITTAIWKDEKDPKIYNQIKFITEEDSKNSEVQITNIYGQPIYADKMSKSVYANEKDPDSNKISVGGDITKINAPKPGNYDQQFYLKYTGSYVDNDECNFINCDNYYVGVNFTFEYIAGYEDGFEVIDGEYKYYTDATEYETQQHRWTWTWDDAEKSAYQADVIEVPASGGAQGAAPESESEPTPTPTPTPTPWTATASATVTKKANIYITGKQTGHLKCDVEDHSSVLTQSIITDIKGRLKYDRTQVGISIGPTPSTTTPSTPTPSTPTPPDDDSIEIAGTIWKDGELGKSSTINGSLDDEETRLNGIEVWLYQLEGSLNGDTNEYIKDLDGNYIKTADNYYLKLAEFYNYSTGDNTNPQLTRYLKNSDTGEWENGRYSFRNLKPLKKYMVVYKYDGMLYENTYGAGEAPYNTNDWVTSSKGSELVSQRDVLNNRFTTIESMPASYKVSTKIFSDNNYLNKVGNDYYNEIYNIKSVEIVNYKEKIRNKITEYLNKNVRLNETDYVSQIYMPIVNNESDKISAMKILQFIYDCRTSAYAGYQSVQGGVTQISETYPYYNQIITSRIVETGREEYTIDADETSNQNDEEITPQEPQEDNTEGIVVESNLKFELPIAGAIGYAPSDIRVNNSYGTRIATISSGTLFKILEENGSKWRIKYGSIEGWIDSSKCMINLPDIIPSIIYNNTNSSSSIYKSSGYDIPGITGEKLYDAEAYNSRLGKEEYYMMIMYPTATKIQNVQQQALRDGYSLIVYETYRPNSTQQDIVNKFLALESNNSAVRNGVNYDNDGRAWYWYDENGIYHDGREWFISSNSYHKLGVAMDVSLARIDEQENKAISINGNSYQYVEINGTELEMPTQMHELSTKAVTFPSYKGRVTTSEAWTWNNAGWKDGTMVYASSIQGEVLANVKRLHSYCANSNLYPLLSEWWHFNDLETATGGNNINYNPINLANLPGNTSNTTSTSNSSTNTNIPRTVINVYTRTERATANGEMEENGYFYIYRGQLYVNLGLVERPTTELKVDEFLNQIVVSINGKDETYKYYSDDDPEVYLTRDDYVVHHIAEEDYNYATTSAELASLLDRSIAHYDNEYTKIEVYMTYEMIIKNDSNIKTAVNEMVAYFDRHFLSYSNQYTTTAGDSITGIRAQYYDDDKQVDFNSQKISEIANISASSTSDCKNSGIYVNSSDLVNNSGNGMTDMIDLYLILGDKILLDSQDQIRIFITYRLGENSEFDSKYSCTYSNGGNSAQNILKNELGNNTSNRIVFAPYTEVNSYSTYIKKSNDPNTEKNNVRERYSSKYTYTINGELYRAAGYLDTYSIPGNLNSAIISKNKQGKNDTWKIGNNGYETGAITANLEYDWARSESLILQKTASTRTITGNVWETEEDAAYYINNDKYPIYKNGETIAKGIIVELIEISDKDITGRTKAIDGKIHEYVRAVDIIEDGAYEFSGFVPGDYVVRFTYGDKAEYDTVQYSNIRTYDINGQTYKYAYNGEFYQSAKANPNTNAQYWYTDTQNRYSDASDEVNIRMHVNSLLSNDSKNGYVYGDLADVTKRPTDYMVYAYTSLLEVEVEYATEETSSMNSEPGYIISNIDFALTPRTETKLNISKEVSNIKLILQDGTVQFDATPETIREQGVPGVAQVDRGEDIFIAMADSIVNGATIEITYTITVANNSKYNSTTYYKDSSGKIVALGLYEEKPEAIVYYEDGKIRTYSNKDKVVLKTIDKGSYNGVENKTYTYTSYIDAGTTQLVTFNTNKTIEETTTTPSLVADFISNNATFSKTNYVGATVNDYWALASDTKDEMTAKYYNVFAQDRNLNPATFADLNNNEVYDNNAIVYATNNNPLIATKLRSGQSSSAEIVLSKVISTENNLTDTKSYLNSVKVLAINNTVSRIQDLASDNVKLKYTTEQVIISAPTGTTINYTIIILTFTVMIIIAVGIILIKKFVLNRG